MTNETIISLSIRVLVMSEVLRYFQNGAKYKGWHLYTEEDENTFTRYVTVTSKPLYIYEQHIVERCYDMTDGHPESGDGATCENIRRNVKATFKNLEFELNMGRKYKERIHL